VVTPDGAFTFYRPDGRPLPNAPATPPVPTDVVASLAATHNGRGLEINASTALSQWRGERLDLDYAILTLRRTLRVDSRTQTCTMPPLTCRVE
jgi:hypothetical protein